VAGGEGSTPPTTPVGNGGDTSSGSGGTASPGGPPSGGTSVGGGVEAGGFGGFAPGDHPDGLVDCAIYARCSLEDRPPGCTCVAIPGCNRGICVVPAALCAEECAGSCITLDSYPLELECEGLPLRGFEGGTGGTGGTHG
jgi:hypothetical protein